MRITNPRTEIVGGRSRRGGLVLTCVLAFCVLLLSAQAPARGRGSGTVLQSWILSAAAPLASAASSVSRAVTSAADSVGDLFRARSENAHLREELAARQREIFQLRAEAVQQQGEAKMAAAATLPNVIGMAPVLLVQQRSGFQSVLIGAGASRGVVTGSPIAVPEGLVGRVVTVGRTLSRAQLLLDTSAAAGARIVRTGELGVVRGDGRGALRLNNIPTTSPVKSGDIVESAGIDGIYPRGVPIGLVESVARGSNLFLEIRVRPSAPFARLTDVLVLAPSPASVEVLGGVRGERP
ncbi:MAG: rod shape-determining protein MreC [Thermoanaerobaculia bacterium]